MASPRRRFCCLIAGSALVASLMLPTSIASARATIDSYCSPYTGDYCVAVTRVNGRIKLEVKTFSFRGQYRLCVRNPVGSTRCHSFRLERHGDIWSDRVDWRRNFPHQRHGRYQVAWHKFGIIIGKRLAFDH